MIYLNKMESVTRKKSSTNWSKNPRNCHVMLKLLGDLPRQIHQN